MKFTATSLSIAILVGFAVAAPLKRAVDPALVPEFGITAGVNPSGADGTGDCDGVVVNGKAVRIPCACPPTRDSFIKSLELNLAAGKVVNNPTVGLTFPTDDSKASKKARINAAAVTLQNLNGSGQGCPIAATTFKAQDIALDNLADTPAPPAPAQTLIAPVPVSSAPAASTSAAVSSVAEPTPSAPAQCPPAVTVTAPAITVTSAPDPAPTSVVDAPSPAVPAAPTPSGALTDEQITALAPVLGHQAGINPDGTGNCDGAAKNKEGKVVLVPCSCPPSQADYIKALTANVKAGKALNNPTVGVSFPTGDSKQDQSTRITAALISLQNLFGPGVGCPGASTTLSIQQAALQA